MQSVTTAVSYCILTFSNINCFCLRNTLLDTCIHTGIINDILLDHRLRGSASPVLTATGLVNGKWQFWPPTESTPLNRSPKNYGDYVGDPYGCAKLGAYLSMGGLWAHGKNITKIIFIYALFQKLTYRSDTSTDIHAWWLKRRGLAQGCAFFGNFSHCSPFRGSKTPKTRNFGAWIGVFKPKLQNRKTCILSKLLHQFQPYFAQW